jgi:GT2 family glycosyltransferase
MSDADTSDTPGTWSAVVVNWNGGHDLAACLTALAAQDWPPADVIVVDNASTDDSLAVLRAFPWVRVVASERNLGFAGGANTGINAGSSQLVATLNPDVTPRPGWARALTTAFAAMPDLGAAGGKLLYPDQRTIQHAGGQLADSTLIASHRGRGEPDDGQYETAAEVDFLTGGALMLRRAALDRVGLFDEAFYPAYYEDVDLCVRLRDAGWKVIYLPAAVGLHGESGSMDTASLAYYQMIHEGRLRFAAKHLPLAEFVGQYLPADARRIATEIQHLAGPAASARAGRDAALTLSSEAVQRASGRRSITSEGDRPRAHGAEDAMTRSTDPRPLLDQIADVGRRWLVEERPFTSSAPLLAPVIVWLRTRLNNAGPRWHVRQILAQQVEFNAAVARALAGVTREAQAATIGLPVTTSLLAEHIEALTAQQSAILARLERLEARLADLASHNEDSAGGTDPPRP